MPWRGVRLEPYAPGGWTIPPIRVERFDPQAPDSAPKSLSAEAIDVTVDTVLTVDPQQADIEDIKDPLTAPLPWGWIAAGAAALALLAWWLWSRRKKPTSVEAGEPPPAPYEVALQRLDRLLRSDLLERAAWKEFYLELTALLRSYIEGQFGMRAPEQTTEEFLAELRRGLAFNPQQRDLLRRILQHGDMVKFAELKPSQDETIHTADLCRQFIEETRPRPAAPAEPVGKAQGASALEAGRGE